MATKKPIVVKLRSTLPTDKILRVNVNAAGYSTKDLTGATMKNSILFFLKQYGWGVYSLSVSKARPEDQYFYIAVVINAATQTAAELERIKQGVGNILRTILPLSSLSASFNNSSIISASGSAGATLGTPRIIASGSAGAILGTSNAGATRRIHITGTAKLSSTLQTVSGAESYTRERFASAGWKLYNYSFQQTSFVYTTFNIDIVADVSDSFTNQQQLDFASSVLSSYVVNLGVTQSKGITDLKLQISGADKPGASQFSDNPTNSIGYNNGGGYGGSGYGGGGNPPGPTESFLETIGKGLGLDSLAKSLGLVAGTATVTAVVVGGVFLLIMLKK